MPQIIMSHKDWLTSTNGGPLSRRSSALVRIDKALKHYQELPVRGNQIILQDALQAWIRSKGNWKNSIRNKRGAVERLYDQVFNRAPVDGNALDVLKVEPENVVTKLFEGAQITWKIAFRVNLKARPWKEDSAIGSAARQYKNSASTNKWGTAANSYGLATNSSTLQSIRTNGKSNDLFSKFLDSIVPKSAQHEVMIAVREVFPNFHAEFAAAAAPLVGVLTACGATAWNTRGAISKTWGIHKTNQHLANSLAGQTAETAIQSLIRILERERNADVYAASVSATELGGKIAAIAMDGGIASNSAISLASNIAKLMNIIRIVYRDVQEKKKANLALKGTLDLKIFETSPLIGCYLVCCAPTSVMMSLILKDFGKSGWMEDATVAS